jgi:hypothetical protein
MVTVSGGAGMVFVFGGASAGGLTASSAGGCAVACAPSLITGSRCATKAADLDGASVLGGSSGGGLVGAASSASRRGTEGARTVGSQRR